MQFRLTSPNVFQPSFKLFCEGNVNFFTSKTLKLTKLKYNIQLVKRKKIDNGRKNLFKLSTNK